MVAQGKGVSAIARRATAEGTTAALGGTGLQGVEAL